MNKLLRSFFWFFIVFSFSACAIEEARPSKKQKIVIASDCLESKDVALFHSFEKYFGIQVKILKFSADSLKHLLLHEGVDTEIDIVILGSIYSMSLLDNLGLLSVIQNEKHPEQLAKKYESNKSTWVGIGIDPYIIAVSNDSNNQINDYKDLLVKENTFYSPQTADFWFPFYASIMQKAGTKNKGNSAKWLKKIKNNSKENISLNDSIFSNSIFFSSYSKFNPNKNKGLKLIFPNQSAGGSYYNMACFGIVKQARNYENATAFFSYLLNESVNKRLNNHWKKFPIVSSKKSSYSYQNSVFKVGRTNPIFATYYYNRFRNILH